MSIESVKKASIKEILFSALWEARKVVLASVNAHPKEERDDPHHDDVAALKMLDYAMRELEAYWFPEEAADSQRAHIELSARLKSAMQSRNEEFANLTKYWFTKDMEDSRLELTPEEQAVLNRVLLKGSESSDPEHAFGVGWLAGMLMRFVRPCSVKEEKK